MMFMSSFLDGVRRRAMRRRVWFKALDGLERGILSLSAKVLDAVDDISCLGVEMVKIVAKIEDALKSVFERRLEGYGLKRAGEIANLAIRFGFDAARGWLTESFVRYVTFMSLNMPVGWSF
jgi:hypothetical protein